MRETDQIRHAVATALDGTSAAVLAVSGGMDSMTLLDAAAACGSDARITVATFDHGTGAAATQAAALVLRRSAALGLEVVAGRADRRLSTEQEFRDARWRFLRDVAAARGARVATAHTESDQIETVLFRILRDAGARGLAGLYARTDVLRPLLAFTRAQVESYARANALEWIDDPSNAERGFARNRIRHELLPALRAVRPHFDRELLEISSAAAEWRREIEALVGDALGESKCDVPSAWLADRTQAELQVLWPTILGRLGVTLDRRGTARLAAFTRSAAVGSRMPLAGGWQMVRSRDAWQLRASPSGCPAPVSLVRGHVVRWGSWSFRPLAAPDAHDAMTAWLPTDAALSVRCWVPGDAMVVRPESAPRKVKQLLSRAGVTGHERTGWPVVVSGDQIVWIPGVRRGDAATARSGRPGLAFGCEHHHP